MELRDNGGGGGGKKWKEKKKVDLLGTVVEMVGAFIIWDWFFFFSLSGEVLLLCCFWRRGWKAILERESDERERYEGDGEVRPHRLTFERRGYACLKT